MCSITVEFKSSFVYFESSIELTKLIFRPDRLEGSMSRLRTSDQVLLLSLDVLLSCRSKN